MRAWQRAVVLGGVVWIFGCQAPMDGETEREPPSEPGVELEPGEMLEGSLEAPGTELSESLASSGCDPVVLPPMEKGPLAGQVEASELRLDLRGGRAMARGECQELWVGMKDRAGQPLAMERPLTVEWQAPEGWVVEGEGRQVYLPAEEGAEDGDLLVTLADASGARIRGGMLLRVR